MSCLPSLGLATIQRLSASCFRDTVIIFSAPGKLTIVRKQLLPVLACCDRLDRTFDCTRTLYPDGVLTMITDEDLIDFEFADFWDDESKEDAVIESDAVIEPDYIKRHISRIPYYGDNSGVAVGISSRYV
jgi:hypothetical protein